MQDPTSSRKGDRVRYKKAPILEAVLEFRWASPRPLEQLTAAMSLPNFDGFGEPKPRLQFNAAFDLDAGSFSHERKQLGFELARRDGSEIVFLEEQGFVFVKPAPYDRWDQFLQSAMTLLLPVVSLLGVEEFSRVGTRFVNRIDIPTPDGKPANTDDFVTIKFDGPRMDRGEILEFQMRVVKPTKRENLNYALVLATTASQLPGHSAILLDIDVFTSRSVGVMGEDLMRTLGEMRIEKNDIFKRCLKQKARDLFGGEEA